MTKAWPDAKRFSPLPKEVYDNLNHTQALVLAWMIHGQAYDERTITVNSHTFTLKQGETWGSLESVREDILAATGKNFTRRQIRYARDMLVDRDYLETVGTIAKGAFGSIHKPKVDPQPHGVDPVKEFRVFYYGNVNDFQYTEIVAGDFRDYNARGNIGKGDAWERQWAKKGYDRPSFVRTGRWRRKEALDSNAPVYMPWIIFDLDRENLLDAFEEARLVLENIRDEGFTLESVYVAFSGRRGVHILFPTGKVGNPIFANSEAAKLAIGYAAKRLAGEVMIDPMPNSPKTLIRVIGSTHDRTENKKRAWLAEDFLAHRPEELLINLKDHVPIEIPDPRHVPADGYEQLIHASGMYAESVMRHNYEQRSKHPSGKGSRGIIERIKQGVNESEEFAPGYTGRSIAMFLLARFLTNNREMTYDKAIAEMLEVNERHDPPLAESRVRYILQWTINNPHYDSSNSD